MTQRSTHRPQVVLIAETRPTIAAGFEVFLSHLPGTKPVPITTGLAQVVTYAEHNDVALIIVGQGLDWASPLSEFRRLRQENSQWRLVLLADVADRETIAAALAAGAVGVLAISVEQDELHAAITHIAGGGIYIPTAYTVPGNPHPVVPSNGSAVAAYGALTPRQIEVLDVLAQGNSNKQIAQILAISESTVSMHLNAVFHALGVHDRTSAAMAYRDMAIGGGGTRDDWSTGKYHRPMVGQACVSQP